MDAAEQRALIDSTQATVIERSSQHSGPTRVLALLLAGAFLTAASTATSGAGPWWIPPAILAAVGAWLWREIGRTEHVQNDTGWSGGPRRRRPDGAHTARLHGPALLVVVSAIGGIVAGWWSGPASLAAVVLGLRLRKRLRRTKVASDVVVWPTHDPAFRPSSAMSDPLALQLVAALAMLTNARISAIAGWLDRTEDDFAPAIEELRKQGYLTVALYDGTETQFWLTRHGRRTFAEHVRAIAAH